MTFAKRFPKDRKGSPFASWEEVELSPEEERDVEELHRQESVRIMRECIADSQKISADLKTDVTAIAVALFNLRASHVVYRKEDRAKQKMEK